MLDDSITLPPSGADPHVSPSASGPTGRITQALAPLPRCCPDHPDWPTLAQHLLADFDDLAPADVVREVGRARQAAEDVGLVAPDALVVGELIARQQLLLLSGRTPDIARLDPERHARHAAS